MTGRGLTSDPPGRFSLYNCLFIVLNASFTIRVFRSLVSAVLVIARRGSDPATWTTYTGRIGR